MTGEDSHNVEKTNLTSFIYLQTTIIITVCIHYMYSIYTAYVLYVYSICTAYVQYVYSMCTHYNYSMCIRYVLQHKVCIQYMYIVFAW